MTSMSSCRLWSRAIRQYPSKKRILLRALSGASRLTSMSDASLSSCIDSSRRTVPLHIQFFSTDRILGDDDKDWRQHFKESLDERDPLQAQEILNRIEEENTADDTITEQELNDLRGQLVDAWIQHQDDLLETYDSIDQQADDRLSQLAEICSAAEFANTLLERIEPSLSRTNLAVSYDGVNLPGGTPPYQHVRDTPYDVTLSDRCDAVLEAWTRAVRAGHDTPTRLTRGIPQRAQFLLDRMQASYDAAEPNDETTIVRPTVDSYNRVLEAWTYSHEHLRGAMAERVFTNLKNSTSARPNGESYKLIIWAWSLSRDRRAAFTATGHLMKMLKRLERGEDDMEPTLDDYHTVLNAWTRAEDKMSPGKAMSVLQLMSLAFDKELTEVQADEECYRCVLLTATHRPLLPGLGLLVDDVLATMKQRFLIPDRECYGAAIKTWKHIALNPDLDEHREKGVRRTLELLAEMKVAHNRSVAVPVQPTTEIINDVIEALSVSLHFRKTKQAEELLEEMERAIHDPAHSQDPKPNATSYRLVLDVWANCPHSDADVMVERAQAILDRMMEHHATLFTPYSRTHGVLDAFNSFVRVCACTRVQSEEEGINVLRAALTAIEGMRSIDGVSPNAATYANLLEAVHKLLPLGKERARVVESIFALCCSDGMVDDTVLGQLKEAATSDQYTRLVIVSSEDIEGIKMVPEAWTLNALGKRVVTADGRKAVPLSIDGKLTVTMAMQEFKMRRLRDKRNRNLLRGGRVPKPAVEASSIQSSTQLVD